MFLLFVRYLHGGQEGELIQRWVMQKAQAKCPVKRLWISSMTDEAIKQGFQELKDQGEYQSLYLAGLSRAIGDWILGMNATRLYTLKYGQNRQVLSIGRVQTPTLALIVNRQKEIDNFVSEPYWVLATIYRDTQFTATSGKFTSKEEGEKAFSTIAGKPFTVTDVSKKKGNEAPPHLYDLTSLQVDCNKKFAYSADITLKLIQSLYEKKYTTYPRVDTQFLTDDIYPKCPQILNGVSQAKIMSQQKYLPLIQQLATISKKLPKSKKVFDNSKVTDHHAIIPTGVPPTGLTDMEANVYDLIAKRFISVFYPDCKFSTTTVLGEVINEDGPKPEKIEFKVSGKEILEPGWRVVYAKDVKNADDDDASDNANGNADSGNGAKKEVVEERTLPSFTKGESGDHQPTLTEKWTTPPKYYTEATLLRAMETAGKFVEDEELRAALKENGIGRPSSRAGIIVPGGFGDRGIEGMILAAQYARERGIPYLGICLNPSLHTVISLFFHIHMVQSVAGIRHCGSSKQTQGGGCGCLHFVPFSFLHGYHFGVLQLSADFFLYHLMNKIGSFRDIVFHLF